MYVLTAGPAEEPVSLAEARVQCEVEDDQRDAELTTLIVAARQLAERETNRVLVTQTWRLERENFPSCAAAICLRRAPVRSITGITYRDADDVQQTLSASTYGLSASDDQAFIYPLADADWPDDPPTKRANAVQVTFVAGYGDPAAAPQLLKQAILMLVSQWFDNRLPIVVGASVAELPNAVATIFSSYRLPLLA